MDALSRAPTPQRRCRESHDHQLTWDRAGRRQPSDGRGRRTQCYFRKRAALAEALRRVQGAKRHSQTKRADRLKPDPAKPHQPAGCRPTLALWGNAKFATAMPGSAASTCRRIRYAAQREPRIAEVGVSEHASSSVCSVAVSPAPPHSLSGRLH